MRRVILQEFVTLDGLAAGPGGSVDFVPAATRGDRAFGREQLALLDAVDTMLLGRVTYQMFAGYWPHVRTGEEQAFADRLNATPKIVFSKTLDRAPWGEWEPAAVFRNTAAVEVEKLKQHDGRELLVWGSLSIARALVNAGLVDEFRLVICPAVLGTGRPLFGDLIKPLDLTLVRSQTFDRAVLLHYTAGARQHQQPEPALSGATADLSA